MLKMKEKSDTEFYRNSEVFHGILRFSNNTILGLFHEKASLLWVIRMRWDILDI